MCCLTGPWGVRFAHRKVRAANIARSHKGDPARPIGQKFPCPWCFVLLPLANGRRDRCLGPTVGRLGPVHGSGGRSANGASRAGNGSGSDGQRQEGSVNNDHLAARHSPGTPHFEHVSAGGEMRHIQGIPGHVARTQDLPAIGLDQPHPGQVGGPVNI